MMEHTPQDLLNPIECVSIYPAEGSGQSDIISIEIEVLCFGVPGLAREPCVGLSSPHCVLFLVLGAVSSWVVSPLAAAV